MKLFGADKLFTYTVETLVRKDTKQRNKETKIIRNKQKLLKLKTESNPRNQEKE